MEKLIKNMEHATVLTLADEVEYRPGQIVSKTLSQNAQHSMTLFAFEKGEEISSHESGGDAFVYALDGVGKITVGGTEHRVEKGQCIVMPKKVAHAVYAEERFKMMLIVMFT